jgi:outer membrane protein OmpA-like peptidoglycan-associated protein
MKLITVLVAIAVLQSPVVFAAANCLHSHSWQCQGHQSQSSQGSQTGAGIATGGQTPNPAQTNTHLGSTSTSSVPMMTLQPATEITPMVALQPATTIVKPPQPVNAIPPQPQVVAPGKVPVLAPSLVPPQPQVVAPGKVPVLAPSLVPPQPQVVAPGKVPVLAPSLVPPQPQVVAPGKVPVLAPSLVPPQPQVVAPGKVPVLAPSLVPPQPQVVAPGKVPVLAPSLVPPQPPVVAPGKVPVLAPALQVTPVSTPSFTGTGKVPPQQVYLVPPKVTTGYAAVPPRPSVTPPPLVPPKQPPVQVYAQPPRTFSGQGKVPVPQIARVPPKLTTPTLSPPRQVYPNPLPIVVGNARVPSQQVNLVPAQGMTAQGQLQAQQSGGENSVLAVNQPSHLLTNNRAGKFGVGGQLLKSDYGNEIVEPGIMNSRVTLYRSHDVKELTFKDTIPMDATGFHLNFVGIREPVFTLPAQSLPEVKNPPEGHSQTGVKANSFVFFFDYASTAIHPDQVGLYDDVVAEYAATGKRLILISETDGFGSFEYNNALASHRGATIVAELQERGVKAADIEMRLLVRYGRSDPSTEDSHRVSSAERIAWVHFE